MSSLIWVLAGLVGLAAGTEVAVRAVGQIAHRLRVDPLIVGLTVASIGTSLPEIATNMAVGANTLAGHDSSGIAVGNIVGSCLSQITLLLGIAGLAGTLRSRRSALRRDGTMLIVALVAMMATTLDGVTSRPEAAVLVVLYAAYVAALFRTSRRQDDATPRPAETAHRAGLAIDTGRAIAALLLVVFSADLVVDQGVRIATVLGVSDTAIGLMVGMGTGLPELAVGLGAALRGEDSIALGNLMGSNITDPLLSFGLGALVHPVTVSVADLYIDVAFWAAGTLIALLLIRNDQTMDRSEAAALVVLFALYTTVRLTLTT